MRRTSITMAEKREPAPPLRRADHEVATGMTEPRMQFHFMGQAFSSLCLPANCSHEKRYEIYESAAKLLEGLAPKDTAETMLAIQMVRRTMRRSSGLYAPNVRN